MEKSNSAPNNNKDTINANEKHQDSIRKIIISNIIKKVSNAQKLLLN